MNFRGLKFTITSKDAEGSTGGDLQVMSGESGCSNVNIEVK